MWQQIICISKAGPSSNDMLRHAKLRDAWVEYKDKVPDVSDSHQIIGTSYNS